jgi:hypothetical protein
LRDRNRWKKNVHSYLAAYTAILQYEHGDIDLKFPSRDTLLSSICRNNDTLSFQNQYDAILLLLDNGADPDRGQVLGWILHRYYQGQCSEWEFIGLFQRIMDNYAVDVNYQEKYVAPFMMESLHNFFYEKNNKYRLQMRLPNLHSWSDQFIVATTIYLQYGCNINIRHSRDEPTLLSKLCNIMKDLKNSIEKYNEMYDEENENEDETDEENREEEYEVFCSVVCSCGSA